MREPRYELRAASCKAPSREINLTPTLARISLFVTITLSRLKPFLQVIHITHVGGVLTPKKQTFSATLNNQLNLARISLFDARYL